MKIPTDIGRVSRPTKRWRKQENGAGRVMG